MSERPTRSDPTGAASSPGGRSRRPWLIAGGLVAVGLLALTVSWYLGRDTPVAVDTQAAIDAATAGDEGERGAETSTDEEVEEEGDRDEPEPAALAADWLVDTELVTFDFDAGTGTFLGFRIDEELTTVGATTAVGRTPDVEGSLLLADTLLDAASVTGDLTALTTDISQRDSRAQRAMRTDTFPTSTFELTGAVDLGEVPTTGETLRVEATGDLTLGGVTQPVTSVIEAVLLDADRLLVTGSFEVLLSDFDLTAPSAPIVVSVADTATIEFQLYLSPA